MLGWRSSDLARVDVPAYGARDAPGRVDLDQHGFGVPAGGPFSEVVTDP